MKMTQEYFEEICNIIGNGFLESYTEDAKATGVDPLSVALMASALGYLIGLTEGAASFSDLSDDEVMNHKRFTKAHEKFLQAHCVWIDPNKVTA